MGNTLRLLLIHHCHISGHMVQLKLKQAGCSVLRLDGTEQLGTLADEFDACFAGNYLEGENQLKKYLEINSMPLVSLRKVESALPVSIQSQPFAVLPTLFSNEQLSMCLEGIFIVSNKATVEQVLLRHYDGDKKLACEIGKRFLTDWQHAYYNLLESLDSDDYSAMKFSLDSFKCTLSVLGFSDSLATIREMAVWVNRQQDSGARALLSKLRKECLHLVRGVIAAVDNWSQQASVYNHREMAN